MATGYLGFRPSKVKQLSSGLNIRVAADFCIGRNPSIANPQQVLPLAIFALEAHALGDLKGCHDQVSVRSSRLLKNSPFLGH
jgi:hypothetical protein